MSLYYSSDSESSHKTNHSLKKKDCPASTRDNCPSICKSCGTRELIRNGGFETPGTNIGQAFAYWNQSEAPNTAFSIVPIPHEGVSAAAILASAFETTTSASLSQNVIVTPGCLYQLSFAEDLFLLLIIIGQSPLSKYKILNELNKLKDVDTAAKLNSFKNLITQQNDEINATLSARVYYSKGNTKFDLINTEIGYTLNEFTAPFFVDNGYHFHQKAADITVPCDVSSVTVEFRFTFRNVSLVSWLLDSVSLRAISSTSVCH